MIEMLAERGLDVNRSDNEGRTPLHYAAAYGQLESVRALLRLGGRESMDLRLLVHMELHYIRL